MGQIFVTAKIQNLEDLYAVHQGCLTADEVRTLRVDDARVDPGATGLMVPTRSLPILGLRVGGMKRAKTAGGFISLQMYDAVRLTIQGRQCSVEVHEIPDPSPVIVGMIPLGALDWVIDPIGLELIGNPEHGGRHMADVFSVR